MNWFERYQQWIDRHPKQGLLLWIILAPAICFAIYVVLALIFSFTWPHLIYPLAQVMVVAYIVSIFIVLIFFKIKEDKKKRNPK